MGCDLGVDGVENRSVGDLEPLPPGTRPTNRLGIKVDARYVSHHVLDGYQVRRRSRTS